MAKVYLLDYGAGNVLSVINAIKEQGCDLKVIQNPEHIQEADKLIFPGVGSFGACVRALEEKGFAEPLRRYIAEGKPLFGICLGMQVLFEGSEESPGIQGLGIIPSTIKKFDPKKVASVPHMGWNGVNIRKASHILDPSFADSHFYFVHSFHAVPDDRCRDWVLTTTNYGEEEFVSSIERGNIIATQFHPEKSSSTGLRLLRRFLELDPSSAPPLPALVPSERRTELSKRIIACLDVRSNEQGDLVVTKGDQYDVKHEGSVRNLGKPVELAHRYFAEGADEITFLNITSFRNCPMRDMPMLEVLRLASEKVFVPLTIGGGIRDMKDSEGNTFTALQVAAEYFRSGADKVSIGSDAVFAVEEYLQKGVKSGTSCIEQIAYVYGSQAVVISVDPKRVYVKSPEDTPHHVIKHREPGPNGEQYCWYQCTVHGGREARDVDVHQLVTVCELLGAGEILLNCIDKDGTNSGFDIDLVNDVKKSVGIPVIASSGAGKEAHFAEVFEQTPVESALAAGIFHRREVPIADVKAHLRQKGIPTRE